MATTPREAFVSWHDDEVVEVILDRLAASLVARSSVLVLDGVLDPGLQIQSRSIIAEVVAGAGESSSGGTPAVAVEYADESALLAHGRAAGLRDVDPAEPLMAAELLFHHALPVLVDALADSRNAVQVAGDLHHAIWRRFPPGAIAYVEVLRDRLSSAHAESRRRISRDLHDRIAPELAIARQRIELANRDRPEPGLHAALAGLDTALREVQSLAFDLRESVGDSGVEQAVTSYIARTPGVPAVAFERHGVERPLPATVAEEAFAVVVECVRNARRHARTATVVGVTVDWREDALLLVVRDDGAGPAEGSSGTMLGLRGMSERASSIGAGLEIDLGADGTTVLLRVPYVLPTGESA